MKSLITLALLSSVWLTTSCGHEPRVIVKNPESTTSSSSSDAASAESEEVQESRALSADSNAATDEAGEQQSEESVEEDEDISRAFLGELAEGDFRYNVEVEKDGASVFLILDVFVTETEENLELDALPQVSHKMPGGCCQPTPPAVEELELGGVQVGALDIHAAGTQVIVFSILIDGVQYSITYNYEAT